MSDSHDATSTTAPTSTGDDRSTWYDLLVLGAGSGGVQASLTASGVYGVKTCLVDMQLSPDFNVIGATSVEVASVTKKLMVLASRHRSERQQASGFGWQHQQNNTTGETSHTFDWPRFMDAKNAELSRLNRLCQTSLKQAGVEIIHGKGRFQDRHTVIVTHPVTGRERMLRAKHIVISVGQCPFIPDEIPGMREYATLPHELFYLPQQPRRVVIVGGESMAVELASILDGLGSNVTLLNSSGVLLEELYSDLNAHLEYELTNNSGIDLRLRTWASEIVKHDNGTLTVVTKRYRGEASIPIDTDCVIMTKYSSGRTDDLNLEAAGVLVRKRTGCICPKYNLQTHMPHIYAVGGVIAFQAGHSTLASREGQSLANTLFGGINRPVENYGYYRGVIVAKSAFTNPEIATCGLTESEAWAQCGDLAIYKTRFRSMKHSFANVNSYTLFKLIVSTRNDKVVGCHMASHDNAGEIMQAVAIAMNMGATKRDFDNTIGIHPTLAEAWVTMRTPSHRVINQDDVHEKITLSPSLENLEMIQSVKEAKYDPCV